MEKNREPGREVSLVCERFRQDRQRLQTTGPASVLLLLPLVALWIK